MWCVTGEAIGSGLLKSIGACIPTPHAPEAASGVAGFRFALSGFGFALVESFLIIFRLLLFAMGICTLCHCVLKVYNFLFENP